MSSDKSSDMNENSEGPESTPSSYFQTEFYSSSSLSKPEKDSAYKEQNAVLLRRKDKSTLELELPSFEGEGISKSYVQRRRVSNGTQVNRNIVGQEDNVPKERKKWIRPPLVGQASNVNDNVNSIPVRQAYCSTDSEEEKSRKYGEASAYFSTSEKYPNRKDYITEKPPEGSSDLSLPNLSDPNESQKIPSPSSISASSITSGFLEWDSSADCGYYHQYMVNQNKDQKLSTLEKIALVRGCASLLTRSDPEGTTGPKKPVKLGLPTAQSTPVSTLGKTSDLTDSSSNSIKNDEKINYHPLFPEVIIKKHVDSSLVNINREKTLGVDKLVISKKLSSSLEHMNDIKTDEVLPSTFPRSHSQSNVNTEFSPKTISNPPKSNSSSSVATVVTNKIAPKNPSKFVQTSVGVQVSFNHGRSNSLPTHSHNGVPCSGAHPKLPPRIPTPEAAPVKSNEVNFSTLESGQLSSEDRANSFEYLPGHIYENVVVNSGSASSMIVHEVATEDEPLWDRSGDNTLKRDVERGVNLLSEFVRGTKAHDAVLKKKLIKKVVEKLINSEYPGDSECFDWIDNEQSPRMVEARGQISGESMEKSETISSAGSKLSQKNNKDKCIGTS